MRNSPTAGPDSNQDGLEPISKYLTREPSRVHQAEILNASQFNLETLKQFVCGVVEVRVAELHVKPLAREFNRAIPSTDSKQEQVASIQDLHRDERSLLSLCTCCERKHRAPNQRFCHRELVRILGELLSSHDRRFAGFGRKFRCYALAGE